MSYASQVGQGPRASPGQQAAAPSGRAGGSAPSSGRAGLQQQEEARSRDGRTEMELLQATRRSLAEADSIANNTMTTLDGQTEQLERIQRDTADVSSNLDQSEHLIRGLKPFGWLQNLFRKEPKSTHSRPTQDAGGSASSSGGYPTGAAPSKAAQRLMSDEAARRDMGLGSGSKAKKPGGAGMPGRKEAEVEKVYDDIDNMLEGLKDKSKEINRTLDRHNQMLPEIGDSINESQDRINQQQRDMKKRMGGR